MFLTLSLKDDTFLEIPFSDLFFKHSTLFVTPIDSDSGIKFPLDDIYYFSISEEL